MRIWRHSARGSEPYLHCVHVCLSTGNLASLLLATQVLQGPSGRPNWVLVPGLSGVQTYFFSTSLIILVATPLFVYMGLCHGGDGNSGSSKKAKTAKTFTVKLLVALFMALYFLRSPFTMLGQLVTVFGSESHLRLSSAEGAQLSAIYFAAFISARVAAICLSTRYFNF